MEMCTDQCHIPSKGMVSQVLRIFMILFVFSLSACVSKGNKERGGGQLSLEEFAKKVVMVNVRTPSYVLFLKRGEDSITVMRICWIREILDPVSKVFVRDTQGLSKCQSSKFNVLSEALRDSVIYEAYLAYMEAGKLHELSSEGACNDCEEYSIWVELDNRTSFSVEYSVTHLYEGRSRMRSIREMICREIERRGLAEEWRSRW